MFKQLEGWTHHGFASAHHVRGRHLPHDHKEKISDIENIHTKHISSGLKKKNANVASIKLTFEKVIGTCTLVIDACTQLRDTCAKDAFVTWYKTQ